MNKKVLCKECIHWKEWMLKKNETLFSLKKALKGAKRGDCFNQRNNKSATFSTSSCEYGEKICK